MILHRTFQLLKRLGKQGFTYFAIGVIFLVIFADNHAEALKESTSETVEVSSKPKLIEIDSFTKADSLIDFALTLNGIPYQYAGTSLQGFDCSGFTYFVFQKFNIPIPRSSSMQYTIGTPIEREAIRKGDLLFFKGPKSEKVGHVGIAVTDYDEKLAFIHSSSGKGGRGVTIDSLAHPHYTARYLGARRINNL